MGKFLLWTIGWGGELDHHKREASTKDIFEIFKFNMKILGIDQVVEPIRMDSTEASKNFQDKSVDLVFIDGDHRYEKFKQDVLAWYPKVKKGGIICGHDCEGYYDDYPKRIKNIIDSSLDKDYIPKIGHPGVIKGLYEIFGRNFKIISKVGIWYHIKT